MHNIEVLVKGKERCTLQMHPNAQRWRKEGSVARIASRVGAVDAVVELTSDIRERVVSSVRLGHNMSGTRMNVAAETCGRELECAYRRERNGPTFGNSVMNGIPVTITPIG